MNSKQTLDLLRSYESRNVTFIDPDGSWPVVWDRAKGVYVWDGEGRRYLDLTGAFGVAAAGHSNPKVIAGAGSQMGRLLHAMGDVHPHELKARLVRELSRITFERWSKSGKTSRQTGKTILCNSGFEAVEAALKTARLLTGKPGLVVFEGAYHGLGYGALNATHRSHFWRHFLDQLRGFGTFIKFPETKKDLDRMETEIRAAFGRRPCGAVLVEPVQVRGGVRIPPAGFLRKLRKICDANGVLLILDEIYTGFGRSGKWFACEHDGIIPDLICLGKALTGGFPLSACVGRAGIMDDAWPVSSGEAIHTSTFLGHPVGCAMALAQMNEIRRLNLVERSARMGRALLKQLHSISVPGFETSARGLGLLAGLELNLPGGAAAGPLTFRVIKNLLHRGLIFLPEGEYGNVLSFTPPLVIQKSQLDRAVRSVRQALVEAAALEFR